VSSCRLPGTLDPAPLKGPKNPAVPVNILETGGPPDVFEGEEEIGSDDHGITMIITINGNDPGYSADRRLESVW
jgi:hypothetical protein